MGPGDWNVSTRDGRRLRVHGELEFTPRGTALVWCDGGVPDLLLGLAPGRWGSIVPIAERLERAVARSGMASKLIEATPIPDKEFEE
jgi:hypothetical protein